MEDMNTKQYLKQISRLDRMIQNKLGELYKLKSMACSITIAPKDTNIQTSSDKDKLGSTVAKIVDLETEIDNMVGEFVDKRRKIVDQIDNMENDDYYHVLSMRYIEGKKFEDISKETKWSERQVFRLHDKAISDFERIYGKEYLSS